MTTIDYKANKPVLNQNDYPLLGEAKRLYFEELKKPDNNLYFTGFEATPGVYKHLVRIRAFNLLDFAMCYHLFNWNKHCTISNLIEYTGANGDTIKRGLQRLQGLNLVRPYKDPNPSVGTQWVVNRVEAFERHFFNMEPAYIQKKAASAARRAEKEALRVKNKRMLIASKTN